MEDTRHRASARDLSQPTIDGLRDRLRGAVAAPGDDGYEQTRAIWNGAIDRKPGLVVRCAGAADVVHAVRFARDHDLLTSVRAGGHGVGGLSLCDDGLVIDLSPMKGIRVDPGGTVVEVQAGVTLGELDRETQPFGLAVPAGIVTHTGVAGLTIGGGIGWLMRKHGLTIDSLRSVDLVTADGEMVFASEEENPDLFWGVRGGGGNFGIVTSFSFRPHPVGPTVLAGPLFFPLERADEVMSFYRDWADAVPDDLTTILSLRRAPALPYIPETLHGVPVVCVIACWAGEIDEGERVMAPLRALGPAHDLCEPKPFLAHQAMLDVGVVPGWHYYWKSVEVPELSAEIAGPLLDHTAGIRSPRSYTLAFQLGGAVARVGESDTAYTGRHSGFAININGVWLPEETEAADPETAWVRSLFRELEPHAPSVYVNFLGDEGQDRVRVAYGPEKYDRLARLKARWDPTNFFRLNQNIRPAS